MISNNIKKDRFIWIDQAKGLGIFLVIYAHNNPFIEHYIYSFHMPLFFLIAGMFHPNKTNLNTIIHRAKGILLPYFFWATLLFIFWVFLGRHYGNSLNYDLKPIDGLIGVFYAQGDIYYMDWGIPMWFLPSIFMTFLMYSLSNLIKIKIIKYLTLVLLICLGFIYPHYINFKLPWSIDVACVALSFYAIGNLFKEQIIRLNSNKTVIFLIVSLSLSVSFSLVNSKIDMYRSLYGNEILFILNGLTGTIFVMLLFKILKLNNFFSFLGRNTIPLLALHFRTITFVKAVLILIGITTFNFNEPLKLLLSIVQVLLILPIIYLVNRYAPILNGKSIN